MNKKLLIKKIIHFLKKQMLNKKKNLNYPKLLSQKLIKFKPNVFTNHIDYEEHSYAIIQT